MVGGVQLHGSNADTQYQIPTVHTSEITPKPSIQKYQKCSMCMPKEGERTGVWKIELLGS